MPRSPTSIATRWLGTSPASRVRICTWFRGFFAASVVDCAAAIRKMQDRNNGAQILGSFILTSRIVVNRETFVRGLYAKAGTESLV
jgi:hypothetical protein